MATTITVFGLGFVGLTTALGFADKGIRVYGYDVDAERSAVIKSGKIPFVEPGVDTALERNISKNFFVTDDPVAAVKESDFVFLCVGTPCADNGEADLRYVYSVLDCITPVLSDGNFRVVITKSTVPPSTTQTKVIPYLVNKGLKPGTDFGVANNPEFLREGKCWVDFTNPDRIVCGTADEKTAEMLRSLYSCFDAPFFAVEYNTGEFIKYLSNTLLATLISYSNEMSIVADTIGGIDIKKAFEILHMDGRWNGGKMSSYVFPGCGYGGYCLPKDTQALRAASAVKGFVPPILTDVIATNNGMPAFMVNKIKKAVLADKTIGILGLSFKPESDDVRDSAAAKIIKLLIGEGYSHIAAYDPMANGLFKKHYRLDAVDYCSSIELLCEKSDVLVLVTAWPEFAGLKEKYPKKTIIDCRYFL